MPKNPMRGWCGGDVEGDTKTDGEWGVGGPITVARASFDPGYSLEETLEAGYMSEADLKAGYCSYGVGVGDGRPKGMIGGK